MKFIREFIALVRYGVRERGALTMIVILASLPFRMLMRITGYHLERFGDWLYRVSAL